MSSPHFWLLLVLFALCVALHYPQQIFSIESSSLFSFLGLSRHALERILLLVPVGYAGYVFGLRAGLASLVIAFIIMLPRAILISPNLPDAMFESIGVVIVGGLVNLWFEIRRQERERQRLLCDDLQACCQQLQTQTQIMEGREKRLAAINAISAITGQSLEIQDVLEIATDKVREVMNLDVVQTFLLDEEKQELELRTYRGVSEEFARGLRGLKVGQGFNGRVAQSGKPLLVQGASQDPNLIREVVERGGIQAILIVPLKAKGGPVGTLSVATRGPRRFLDEEVELLNTVGSQIGIAVENARLYERQRLAAQQALASERRYREVFESASDAIWIHDLQGNITAVNKALERLTGYTSEELLKMNVRSFLTEASLHLARGIRYRLFLGETVEQPYEQRLIRKDGSEAILKLTTNLIREDGAPHSFHHIARDVTEEKKMHDDLRAAYLQVSEYNQRLKETQEQLIQVEKLTSLGQMAAAIAHEVNNPLAAVLVGAQLLIKKINDGNISTEIALDYLSRMESELTRTTQLIGGLLDFARQSPQTFSAVKINDVVDRALELVAHQAELQKIQVVKDLGTSLPTIGADFDQLQQVCTNLILNSIQAMPDGGRLTLRTSADDDQLIIQVQDTGCGIPREHIKKLFTPFFTTKSKEKGTGLGLAVVYGIVQRHQGKIEVESEEGKGATFTVYLPLHPQVWERKGT